MAKKRTPNPSRSRQFKYANPTGATVAPSPVTETKVPETASKAVPQAPIVTSDGRNFSYVTRDLRRIVVIGGTLLVVELALRFFIT